MNAVAQTPIASYYFSGNANDNSGNELNGINHGAELTTDRFGDALSAYHFDGVDDYIEIPFSEPFNFGTGDFAISLWFKPDSNKMGMLLQKGGKYEYAAPSYFIRNVDQVNGYDFFFVAGDGIGSSSYARVNGCYGINHWNHIVVQRKGNLHEIYVNSVLLLSNYQAIENVNDDSNILIGTQGLSEWNSNYIRYFYGAIDDIKIYDVALDLNTIDKLHWERDEETVYVYDTTHVTVFDTVLLAVTDTLYIDATHVNINEEEEDIQIKLFPNPTRDILHIQNNTSLANYNLFIYNLTGQFVYGTNLSGTSHQVSLQQFGQAGSYVVKLYNDNGDLVETKTIILE